MNRHYYLIFIFTLISWVLNAQLPKNPFEIREISPTEQVQKDSTGSIFQAFNPFELVQPTYPIVQNKEKYKNFKAIISCYFTWQNKLSTN